MAEYTDQELRASIATKAYADPNWRKNLIADPKATVEAYIGTSLPSGTAVQVVEDTDSTIHLVIPPANTAELSDAELEAVSGGFLDAKGIGSSVFGDGMLCLGGAGLVNSKMEINL